MTTTEDLESKKKLLAFLELLQSDMAILSIWVDILNEEIEQAEDEVSL